MAITSLDFAEPVRRLQPPTPLDYELLERAMATAEQGDPRSAIAQVFAHVLPGAEVGDLAQPFVFVQGSSHVACSVEHDRLTIRVPLCRLAASGNPVAAMRYALTRVAGSGQLFQPRLDGDDLYLAFQEHVARLHPAKLLEVLRQMPVAADRADDWLIGEFGAEPLDRAPIESLTPEEAARGLAFWRQHWSEVLALLDEAQRRRSTWFLNEVTALAVFRLRFMLPLHGHLAGRLGESSAVWNNADVDQARRTAELARCGREMLALSPEELTRSLGHVSYALSPVTDGTPETITGLLGAGDYTSTIDKLRTSGRSMEAALALSSSLAYLLASFAWPAPVAGLLLDGLRRSGGLAWRDAAALLWDSTRALVDRIGGDGGAPPPDAAPPDDADSATPTDAPQEAS